MATVSIAWMTVPALQMNYMPFRKNFYNEVPEIAKMSDAEVTALRKELDGIKVRVSEHWCVVSWS